VPSGNGILKGELKRGGAVGQTVVAMNCKADSLFGAGFGVAAFDQRWEGEAAQFLEKVQMLILNLEVVCEDRLYEVIRDCSLFLRAPRVVIRWTHNEVFTMVKDQF
jgi:hypothetical protein